MSDEFIPSSVKRHLETETVERNGLKISKKALQELKDLHGMSEDDIFDAMDEINKVS